MALLKHEGSDKEIAPRSRDLFDRFFDDRHDFFRRPIMFWPGEGAGVRVEEFREDGTLVVRAELAGIDPDKDVEISVSDHTLHIEAERHEEEKKEGRDYVRQEFRYGSFARDLPLPSGVGEADVKASYKDGILEVRVPMPETKPSTKIPVAKS
jgi:HSP20 family protein